MRTGCVRRVVLVVLDPVLRAALAERLSRLEGVELDVTPGEEPLDLYRLALWASRATPPDQVLIVTDAAVILGAEEARTRIGLVKLLRVRGCSIDDIVASVEAVSCKPVSAPCPVDAGLGWLQV